jgi:hypothetical protein
MVLSTHRWRKMDSNHRSLAGWSPLLDFAPFHGLEHGRLAGFDDTLRPAHCCGDVLASKMAGRAML